MDLLALNPKKKIELYNRINEIRKREKGEVLWICGRKRKLCDS